MEIFTFTSGPFSENSYLLTLNGQALLVDPGFFEPAEFEVFREELKKTGSELIAVLLTHAHVDHILGLERVLKEYEVPVYLNHSDLYLWNQFPSQAAMFGIRTAGFGFIPEPLDEQSERKMGAFTFDVLYTPGHAPDHTSFYFKKEGVLISGDVLFRESIGRTDLYKGDFGLLSETIELKLYVLPDETRVCSGHGPVTTIGHEKKFNAFVKAADPGNS